LTATHSLYTENTDFTKERLFTISILSENKIGLLHAISIIFTRRKLNIDSFNVSESEVKGVSRFTIVLHSKRSTAEKVVKQIEKLIEVLAAFLYEESQIHYLEIALYKISKKIFCLYPEIVNTVTNHQARFLRTEEDYDFILIEKTGHKRETTKLFHELEQYGVSEFVRSGRIALSKSKRETTTLIEQLENSNCNLIDS
jgi:acetolactate synthase-1/3 small subunit